MGNKQEVCDKMPDALAGVVGASRKDFADDEYWNEPLSRSGYSFDEELWNKPISGFNFEDKFDDEHGVKKSDKLGCTKSSSNGGYLFDNLKSQPEKKSDAPKYALPDPADMNSFFQSMEDLFISGRFYDVKILVNGEELRAHKAILATRSPVFSAIFEQEIPGKNSGVVEISDCKLNIFREFLHYLYTGKIENVSKSDICGMFMLAEKYDVQQLKRKCIAIMKSRVSISIDNFCDVISFAIKYQEDELLKKSTDYFLENAKSILKTTRWKTFMVKSPDVANELILKTLGH